MEHLCYTKNHIEIVYETTGSHVATHLSDTPELKPAIIEVLGSMDVAGDRMYFEHDIGRVIGTADLVTTTAADEIVFAKRKNRDIYTRFTKSQQPQSCSKVTINIERLDDYKYLLWSAWIGYKGPAFPGDANETADSKEYWAHHALAWGRQEIQADTITTTCPW